MLRRRSIFSWFFVDRCRSEEDILFILGSGRGGTTWVAEVLNSIAPYRYIFEPFDRRHVREARCFGLRQYLSAHSMTLAQYRAIRRIVGGKIRSWWTDRYNIRMLCKKRLIKDIRCHLMLTLLKALYPQARFVLLVRNPLEVVRSQANLGWQDNLDEILEQREIKCRVNKWLGEGIFSAALAKSHCDRLFAQWCIENKLLLESLDGGNVYLVRYEDLLDNSQQEWSRLLAFLELNMPQGLERITSRASAMSRKDTAKKGSGSMHFDINPEMRNVYERLGLTVLYEEPWGVLG